MAKFEFEVRQIPAGVGTHSWEVIEPASGRTSPLPQGGTGDFVGAYPEIENFLQANYQKSITIKYAPSLDSFNPDYAKGTYEWRFKRSGDEIVVKDISRVIASISIGN